MSRPRILIVEDEPIIALSLQAIIEDLDFIAARVVGSGREGIATLENELLDLVLMDIFLDEEMNGVETAEIIRERYDIPVVFVTALKDAKLVGRAKDCGAFGYVTKPFDRENISNAIELALFRHAMDKRLRESEERFRIFAEYTCDWEYWLGPDGQAIYHSPSCLGMTGYSAAEFMERSELIGEIVHPDDAAKVKQHIHQACVKSRSGIDIDFRIITREGDVRWLNHVCQSVHDKAGQFRGRRAGNRDITVRKQLELKLEHMAIHDGLTGLPNRELLLDRLALTIAAARRKKSRMAVLFVDLDNFKIINDSFGHRVGDLTLKEVARRILASIRHSDTVARLGGDEFIVVLSDVAEGKGALLFARKVSQVLGTSFIVDGKDILIQASIGVAIFPEHGQAPEELIAKADAAMYQVKIAGRQGIKMASPD